MNKIFKVAVLMFVVFTFYGCTAKKKVQKQTIKLSKMAYETMQDNFIQYETFSAKTKVKANLNGKSRSFTVNVRLLKNKMIWMSVSPLLGIEVGRALITPDSIKLLNRLDKTYYEREFDFVKTEYGLDVDFEELQALLTGQLSLPAKESFKSASKVDGKTQLLSNKNDITYLLNLNSEYLLLEANRKELNFDRTVHVKYDDYFKINGKHFPRKQNASFVQQDNQAVLQLNYSKVKLDEKLSYPFSVSSKYKKL